ncbi:Uncharacterized membrane protein YckC, RDD family [Pseudoalteromonas sp. DSM 26666]|uniref:RDD family protein n=1 Tax=Pseudoalteromonas sp. DSM 26666 TaxID=1761892 RepID=UPI0008E0EDD7|nr:RDD family protein [Pseudoalteromonas sp. DSM 26666]SFT41561.1 Uncharacterized membrane protein YckC, RDD family [Pseudoalteromonas sp. DSM 26666]
MDFKVDFSSYSLDDLYSSAKLIDRELYPERAREIDELIRQKQTEPSLQSKHIKQVGEKASRSVRLLAALIDGFFAMIAIIVLIYFIGFDLFKNPTLMSLFGSFLYGLFFTVALHGYFLHFYGQTIGKHFMSIRIENLDGTKASFATIYFKRMLPMQLMGLIPAIGQLIVGFINPMFIFGKEKRCLHDYIAKTKVSYTNR